MLQQIKETEELIAEIKYRCYEIMEMTKDIRVKAQCQVLLNHASQKEQNIEKYFRGLGEFVDERNAK